VCYEPLEPPACSKQKAKCFHASPSPHGTCTECMAQYVETRIDSNQVERIKCPAPGCSRVLTDADIGPLLDESTFERLKKFRKQSRIDKNPHLRWCSVPGCEGHHRISPVSKKGACSQCKTPLCLRCGQLWHEGQLTCDQLEDQSFQQWARGKDVRSCPRCGIRIEKVGGCEYMVCSKCREFFLWPTLAPAFGDVGMFVLFCVVLMCLVLGVALAVGCLVVWLCKYYSFLRMAEKLYLTSVSFAALCCCGVLNLLFPGCALM